MEPTTALSVSAQIAVAMAGFAGVVTAFRKDLVRDWGHVETFWLRLLLTNSILPLAFSMFGLFLLTVPSVSTGTWRWCSGIAALFLVPYEAMIVTTLVRLAPGQLEAAGGKRITSYLLVAILTTVCLLQVFNVARLA